ncbi:DUF3275 family protein [Collimonas silvisoli]|uniref:DUF3275 family protein n=1 Tax=Collimonas silvisoli TaxID=2825884 RepID=UPI001B8ACA9F|nr:DUF3275 family protein [Collimonas silvisoli]
MITLSGQLAIKTIHGRNGAFNVGRLATSIGEFVIKNAELEQYREGKYDGDFAVERIYPYSYATAGRMVIEVRAHLAGMTLSGVDGLSNDDASKLATQEPDPIDEETVPNERPQPAVTTAAKSSSTTPDTPAASPGIDTVHSADAELFGPLWPLGAVVKLDSTVDRLTLRQQCVRLNGLGYEFKPLTQEWLLIATH